MAVHLYNGYTETMHDGDVGSPSAIDYEMAFYGGMIAGIKIMRGFVEHGVAIDEMPRIVRGFQEDISQAVHSLEERSKEA